MKIVRRDFRLIDGDAQEVVNEAFVAFMQQVIKHRRWKVNPSAYLQRIVKNKAIDHIKATLRGHRRLPQTPLEGAFNIADPQMADSAVLESDLEAAVRDFVGQMQGKERAIGIRLMAVGFCTELLRDPDGPPFDKCDEKALERVRRKLKAFAVDWIQGNYKISARRPIRAFLAIVPPAPEKIPFIQGSACPNAKAPVTVGRRKRRSSLAPA